tara:strand:+ start:1981 stop:5229 length:3249 start_codon:yes stop_codon:yes gene_type:complete
MLGLGSSNLSQGVVQSALGKLISRIAGRSTYSENKSDSKSTILDISKGDILDKAAILLTPTSYSDGNMHSVQSYTGEEIVANGGFDTSIALGATGSGWGLAVTGGSTITYSNGGLKFTQGAVAGLCAAIQYTAEHSPQTMKDKHRYKVTYNVTSVVGTPVLEMFVGSYTPGATAGGLLNVGSTVGTHTFTWTHQATLASFRNDALSTSITIDNVSVKEVPADFIFTRDSSATRVGPNGLLQDMQDVVGESELILNGDFSDTSSNILLNADFSDSSPASQTGLDGGLQFAEWYENPYATYGLKRFEAIEGGIRCTITQQFTGPTWHQRIYQYIGESGGILEIGKSFRFRAKVRCSVAQSNFKVAIETTWGNVDQISPESYSLNAGEWVEADIYFRCTAINDPAGSATNVSGSDRNLALIFMPNTLIPTGGFYEIKDLSIERLDPNNRWTPNTGWSIGENEAIYDGGSPGSPQRIMQNLTTIATNTYKLRFKVDAVGGTSAIPVYFGDGDPVHQAPLSTGYHTFYTAAFDTTSTLSIYSPQGQTLTVSDISITDITLADDLDIPRISYDKDGLNGHILLEPTRTNLVTYSEDFTDYYTLAASLAYDASIIAPDGTAGVWQLLSNEVETAHYMRPINSQENYEFLWGEQYTFSVYVKANAHDHIRLMIQTAGGGGASGTASVYASAYYDLVNNKIPAGEQVLRTLDAVIEDVGGGWKRCSLKGIFNLNNAGTFKMSGTINGQLDAGESTTVVLDESMNFGTINDNTTLTAGCKMYTNTGANPTLIGTVTNISGTSVTLAAANAVECVDGATIYFSTLGGIRIQIAGNLATGPGYGNKSPLAGGCYFWGVQFEKGNYVSSYIPTLVGSTVTRDAELLNGSGNSSLITNTEGVLYAEIANFGRRTNTKSHISLSNLTANSIDDSVVIGFNATNDDDGDLPGKFYARIEEGGGDKATWSGTDASDGVALNGSVTYSSSGSNPYFGFLTPVYHKVALQYKTGDSKLYVNGSDVGAATTGNITNSFTFSPILDSLAGAQRAVGATNPFYGRIKCIAYFDEVLTDEELEALTGDSYNSFSELVAANGYTIQ